MRALRGPSTEAGRRVGEPRRIRILGAGLLVLAVACSGNGTAPLPGPAGIRILAGNRQADTVNGTLGQALTVQVVTESHQPAKNQVVQFVAIPARVQAGDEADVEQPNTSVAASFIADSADASGRATVLVVLGTQAGTAHIIVRVPTLGFVDTAVFTVEAGSATQIAIAPRDTAAYVDSTLVYSATTLDRFGNPRADSVTYAIAAGSATVSGTRVTPTAFGQASVVANSGNLADTAHLAVVPVGTIAAGIHGAIAIFNTNGSGFHQIPVPVGSLKWAPSGTQLVFDGTVQGLGEGTPVTSAVDVSGNVTIVDVAGDGFVEQWPQVSRDGMWVYFCRIGSDGSTNWRAHLNGSGNDSLPSMMPDFDIFATPSPDGQHVAYVADHGSSTDLRVVTLATGAVSSLHVDAWSPVWSPTSDLIAYIGGPNSAGAGPLFVIHSDGTRVRLLGSHEYNTNIDWSPDGQWVVASDADTGQIDLLSVTSPLVVPLHFTFGVWSPTWKPK